VRVARSSNSPRRGTHLVLVHRLPCLPKHKTHRHTKQNAKTPPRKKPKTQPQKKQTTNRLQALNEYIEDTEDLVNLKLDQHRNELIGVDLVLTAASLCMAMMTAVAGYFGMVRPFFFFFSVSIAYVVCRIAYVVFASGDDGSVPGTCLHAPPPLAPLLQPLSPRNRNPNTT